MASAALKTFSEMILEAKREQREHSKPVQATVSNLPTQMPMGSRNKENNVTAITEFFLLGFQVSQDLRILLFCLLLWVNCCTLCGNLLIIILVSTSKKLHTPMYLFISQLSINDMLLTTVIVPFMLHILLNNGGTIGFTDCIIQFYFFCTLEIFECLLLTVMSYDRYVAICNPLHYSSIMTNEYCVKLLISCWLAVLFIAAMDTVTILMLKFCKKNVIDHFFCDIVPLLEIACSGTQFVELEVSALGPPVLCIPLIIIIVSYSNIIVTIYKIPSNISRRKAFSTCSSHLIVVSIFYCTLFSVYVVPTSGQSLTISKVLSLIYTVVTPFINPIIYIINGLTLPPDVEERAFGSLASPT
ncbi:olfactory receptor-like protein I9 [Bufo bufo]|uniref:olfactory receptor-like protein I9 n=1 Tax=Bufo bufo TaxID=8384 RepID=UPI001ABDFEAC|nr:olfactory receptor-like protein I9 [Bufo bufo]